MRLVDMHLNPVATADETRLRMLSARDLQVYSEESAAELDRQSVERGVLVVLTDGPLDEPDAPEALAAVRSSGRFDIAMAVDFRRADAIERIERARSLGVSALKFHAYYQQIEPADHEAAVALSRRADALGMFVMVCCSYGTRMLDRHSGLRLAAAIAPAVTCPVVMSHAGGRQVLDAMLVAEDLKNVYLETSFSLSYYTGSSVEQDFAFAMRRLGTRRWLFGSDAPFVSHAAAAADVRAFFDRHRFSGDDADNVFHRTATTLLESHR